MAIETVDVLTGENEYLRSLVGRLNTELARYHEKYPLLPSKTADSGTDVLPSTPFLAEASVMMPLLAEYDARIASLEGQNTIFHEELQRMRDVAKSITEENERLYKDLAEAGSATVNQLHDTVTSVTRPSATAIHPSYLGAHDELNELRERLDISSQENELLLTEQRRLHDDLSKTKREVEARSRDLVSLSSDLAAKTAELDQAYVQIHYQNTCGDDVDSRLRHTADELQKVRSESNDLSTELRQERLAVKGHLKSITDYKRALQEMGIKLQTITQDNTTLLTSNRALEIRLRSVNTSEKELAESLKAKDRKCTSQSEAINEIAEANSSLQERLTSSEQQNIEAYQHVKESIDLVEEARLERDRAVLAEQQTAKELSRVQARLAKVKLTQADQTLAEVESIRATSDRNVAGLMEELAALETVNAELQNSAERAHRERRQAENELRKFSEETPVEHSRLEGIIEDISTRLRKSERECAQQVFNAGNATASLRHMENELEQSRASFLSERQDLQRRIRLAEKDNEDSREGKLKLLQNIESLRQEIKSVQLAADTESRKHRQETDGAQRRHAAAIKELQGRLEQAEDSHRNARAELQNLLGAQQRAAAQWREESRSSSKKLESSVAEMREEVDRLRRRNAELNDMLALSNHQTQLISQQADDAKRACAHATSAHREAEIRAEQVSAQLTDLVAKERDLVSQRKTLNRELTRAKMEANRAHLEGTAKARIAAIVAEEEEEAIHRPEWLHETASNNAVY